MGKKILSYASLITLLIPVFSCGDGNGSQSSEIENRDADTDVIILTLSGQTGKSVFEITAENSEIDYISGSMGIFIKSIDTFTSGQNGALMFSVNDSIVPLAADKCITNDTDSIRWHYKKF